ncbi:MAG: metallophosphoesterase family protein, partial [Gammaproteobacteria bacterium]
VQPTMQNAFTLAQIADLHVPPVRVPRACDLLNKRLGGWISWKARRHRIFRREILDALIEDLKVQDPDHIAVTGDLINFALEEEFVAAALWLRRLGPPRLISVVPGNHDAYVPLAAARSWDHWAPYMASDHAPRVLITEDSFPTVRMRGLVAVVGLCSAQPTEWSRAWGTVGPEQLERLELLLGELGRHGLCRVVQIHHPPLDERISQRSRLTDSACLREVLARAGAELVMHAHAHVTSVDSIAGPENPIPVVGVRSASNLGRKTDERAQYHLYRIEEHRTATQATRYRITMAIRGWDAEAYRFAAVSRRELTGSTH